MHRVGAEVGARMKWKATRSVLAIGVIVFLGSAMPGPVRTGVAQAPAPAASPGPTQAPAPEGDFLPRPAVVAQTPDAQRRLLLLPEGFSAQPILSDPTITDPVGVTFDGNGRMYVLEMRTYMLDADGSNSRNPVSRISRHEDADGDGVYESHTVFADGLVMPRIAFPLQDGVLLVLETDNRDLYKYTDTNGDGVSDTRELFYANFGRVTNVEWQPAGMTWALDNWIYTTYNPFRLRLTPDGKVLREETDVNGGQWGVNQDNYGKLWFVDGAGGRPVNFQQPIVYGAFNVPDNFEDGFQEVWAAPGGLADMQGGMNSVRLPDQTLARMTGAAGPEIYRGHRLPPDLVGDLFFGEPVGRIVRRAKVVETDGMTQLRNAHPKSEFMRSTDPLFRPVNVANAPDGTLYVTDMYTGIIQEANFTRPGSYLRRKIEQCSLDQVHNRGRIWRITYTGLDPDRTRPRMYGETSAQLVAHLAHPNGWWRDTAQKLLVLRQDRTVVPALDALVRTSTNQLARIHALWTLEGLGALPVTLARTLMKDADPKVRIQAIRASESLYKAAPANRSLAADYLAMTKDADPTVVIQAMLTMKLQGVANYEETTRGIRETSTLRGPREIATQILRPQSAIGQPASNDAGAGYLNFTAEDRRTLLAGERTYRELCFSCHGEDGRGAPAGGVTGGPLLGAPIAGSPRVTGHRDFVIQVMLHGLTGPIEGVAMSEGSVMVPMASNSDEWIADVSNFIRNAFGNSGRPLITPAQVAAVRRTTTRRAPWTVAELTAALPALLTNAAEWKVSASLNTAAAAALAAAPGAPRWDTGAPQAPGQWFQIELPQPTLVAEIQIDATAPTGRATGGLGGFGGLGGTVTPPPARGGGGGGGGGRGGGGRGGGRGGPAAPVGGPVAYQVQTSDDGTAWSAPLAQGAGAVPTTVIVLKPVQAKFIRITQTGRASDGEWWAVQQVRVYQAPGR
jgi:glucose/arabinose dehydrogenase/mono/diheme cytochrome c family protein